MSKTIDFEAIQGGNKKDKSVEGALEYFRNNQEEIVEAFSVKAFMRRSLYTSLINEGFTKEEALEIVKHDNS